MKLTTEYIQFDQKKLDSIGFSINTIHELICKFTDYLTTIENEYRVYLKGDDSKKEISSMLHKLEGSLHYLALTGPISYIYIIKETSEYQNSNDIEHLIDNLFAIIHETVIQLKQHYGIVK